MFLKKLLFILLATFSFQQTKAFTFNVPYTLTESDINQYLKDNVSIQQAFGFPGFFTFEYQIENLHTQIGETENQIKVSANVVGKMQLVKEEFQTQIHFTFSATPYYDSEKGAIFLKDFNILQSSITPEKYMHQLDAIMPLLNDSLAKVLSHKAIYQLNEEKTSQMLIKKFAKAIVVEKEQLRFEVEVF